MQRSHRIVLGILVLALCAGSKPGAADEPLTIASIMRRDWIGTPPTNPFWSDDGKSVYYERLRPGSEVVELHRVDVSSGRDERLEPGEQAGVEAPGGTLSRDRKQRAYVRHGDLFARQMPRGRPRQLTRTAEAESHPLFLSDGRRVAFRRGDRFLAYDLDSGTLEDLADLRLGDDPRPKPVTGFLGDEQRRLFASVRERIERRDETEARSQKERAEDPTRAPEPWYLGAGQELLEAALAPSGRHLLAVLAPKRAEAADDDPGARGGRADSMPVWVTEDGYVEIEKVRPKVGTGSPKSPTIALLDLATHERRDLDLAALPGLAEDPLAELRAAARAARGDDDAPKGAAEPRVVHVDRVAWNDAGTQVALQISAVDNKDRWLARVDPATGTLQPVDRQSDPAWVSWGFDAFGWMRDGSTLWYLSEASGYSHLYLAGPGARRQLTRGPFEVDHPYLSRDGKSFLVSANREEPGIVEIYRVAVDGGELVRLTSFGGLASAVGSPDEKELLLTVSTVGSPPELYVQAARPGAAAKRLTETTSEAFRAVDWTLPEVVPVPSRHGAGEIWSRVYRPAGWSPEGTYPAVLFVHGAGYLQNAHHGWSDYSREFMFHTLLARRGYVVLDMDYRASAGYGRDWRTAIYRQMGSPELEDLEDGVAWLVDANGVDPARVGVYGGSYGGFLTFMALFKQPELFAAGAALRPVSDWAHYNHGYTSAILNTPEVDPEAYRRSSPIELAEGLAKPLLICHGMVDDNVVFQDTARIVQRLIELGKTDLFETAIYPVESHGFREPASWVDEYKRIWNLFERELWR